MKKYRNMYNKKRYNNIKIKILSVLIIYLLIFSFLSGCTIQDKKTIKVSGAFALYPMMNIWADEYKKINPDIKIEVSAGGAGKGMSDTILGIVDIGMVSRGIYQEEINQGIFWVSVAKDAVVATINTANPVIEIILTKGLTRRQFEEIFIKRNITTWGRLVGIPDIKDSIRVYTRSDACGAAETWALYLGEYNQDDLTNIADSAINGDPNLAAAIQGDKLGIGFNNINFVYDSITKRPFDGLKPVPIDLDENGLLDEYERFYDTRDEIVNSIANDIYPSPPARALHLVTKNNFSDITQDFIYWILTDGQEYVSTSGYIELSEETISEQISYLERGER